MTPDRAGGGMTQPLNPFRPGAAHPAANHAGAGAVATGRGAAAPIPAPVPAQAWRELGALLRRARIRRGLTMAALAAQCRVTHQQLHKYETGQNRIPADRLFWLAARLGLDDAAVRHALTVAAEPRPPGPEERARDRIAATLARLAEPDLCVVQATASALLTQALSRSADREAD